LEKNLIKLSNADKSISVQDVLNMLLANVIGFFVKVLKMLVTVASDLTSSNVDDSRSDGKSRSSNNLFFPLCIGKIEAINNLYERKRNEGGEDVRNGEDLLRGDLGFESYNLNKIVDHAHGPPCNSVNRLVFIVMGQRV
jgi:hypothetical protein